MLTCTVYLLLNGVSPVMAASTEPEEGLETNGNWSHVAVDLNSLNKLEKEILTASPSSVATSM